MNKWLGVISGGIFVVACGEDTNYLSRQELLKPETCKSCHPNHFEQWAGSMHAYAADDPVFLAMNARGQEETNGELGDFCVSCHAPLAVRDGLTTDGLNLDDVPQEYKGVTCYFCHTVASVDGQHNNPLVLADDNVMRGEISDPLDNGVHRAAYSPLHDRTTLESSDLCGACHDIVTPAGVHLERTFAEWKDSIFSDPDPAKLLSCGRCHMKGETSGPIAVFPGVVSRDPKEHLFAGLDVAITDWPGKERQLVAIDDDLRSSVAVTLCIVPNAGGHKITYRLDNVGAGHMVPSGAGQDRRMWAEIVATIGQDTVFETGVVPTGTAVSEVAKTDLRLWQIRDFAKKEDGTEAHMFWDVASIDSQLLPPQLEFGVPHTVERDFNVDGAAPERITAKLHVRPIGLDVLDDLIASGHLDSVHRDSQPTFTIDGATIEWNTEQGFGCFTR